ncbi:DNA methyltransferase [Actinotignum sp. GS-2025b]|uniref:site-specific DNA-methyltransferase n=1 Tax=Actinotignum sp. GS-2025b TaxID=3427275 RepID=UPI003F4464F5
MNREAREHNETITPNSAQIERLRIAFPEYFDEQGSFMLDRFEQMLKEEDLNLTREGYELKFLGKSYAKYLAGLETETVVVPDLEHNAEPENKDSENLYIVGDNLDALQHLVKSYAGKVKCIYIDPPYNTGSDGFVYNDDFGFTAQQLVERIGISEDEVERILDMQGKSSHSAWLTFIYPRLVLARELLSDDGVIFISIDENEQANLTLLCDEVFGEQNSIGTLIWKSTPGSNTGSDLKTVTEYVVTYAKNAADAEFKGVAPDANTYRRRDEHFPCRGPYKENKLDRRMTGNHYSDSLNYPIPMPDGTELWPGNSTTKIEHWNWRWNQEKVKWGLKNGFILCKQRNGSWSVYFKQYLLVDNTDTPINRGVPPKNLLEIDGLSVSDLDGVSSARGTADAISVLGEKYFDYPKPLNLIKYLLSLMPSDGIYVDFFSGSATTAEAALRLNAETSSTRRWILVQIPELVAPDSISSASRVAYRDGFRTIDEIGRERIKRAAAKIKEDTDADIDYGFKLVRLESPKIKTLDELDSFTPDPAEVLAGDYVSKFDLDGTPGREVVLTTWLNQDGFGLLAKPRKVELVGYVLDVCEDSAYIINPGITSEDLQELVRRLETNELQLSRVVVFPYSVTFSVMHELKKNLSVLKSGQSVEVIERF